MLTAHPEFRLTSNLSAFIIFIHAAVKSFANFSFASEIHKLPEFAQLRLENAEIGKIADGLSGLVNFP